MKLLRPGDRIKIIREGYEGYGVNRGDEFVITVVDTPRPEVSYQTIGFKHGNMDKEVALGLATFWCYYGEKDGTFKYIDGLPKNYTGERRRTNV